MTGRVARHLTIEGRVQGVYFRAWTQETASVLGLDGWVRNRADGSVEAVAAGPEADVATLVEKAHRGPMDARVTGIEVREATGEEAPRPGAGFEIRR